MVNRNKAINLPKVAVDIGSAELQYRWIKKLVTPAAFTEGGAEVPERGLDVAGAWDQAVDVP